MKKHTKSYSREFKLEAARLLHESDRTVAEVANELGISKSSLFRWRQELADDPEQAFPGRGQMKDHDAEISRLRQELREAQLENEILKKATAIFARKELRFQFIQDHRHRYPVELMCRQILQVSRSGYYAWRKRKPSARKMANETLLALILLHYRRNKGVYGSPRIYAALRREGIRCSRKRVARLMRLHGIHQARRKRSYKVTTQSNHRFPVAANLLNQQFTAVRPNQVWLGDITHLATAEGWLYLAVLLDLYSRKIVGWLMQATLQRQLVIDTFRMAFRKQHPQPGLLHHSDQGSQYASYDYQRLLTDHQVQMSMSRRGNCFDNAPVESFFATLKAECVRGIVYPSRAHARAELFEYIEIFYNRQRLHSQLGYRTPVEYELLPAVSELSVH